VAASAPSTADELAKLADLRDRGVISLQEFARAKERLLGTRLHVEPDISAHRG
jgi:hypothetical protein